MQDAVFGNVGTMGLFSVGGRDAVILEKEFMPYFTAEDLISLDKYHLYLKLLVDGMTSKPFSAISLTPPEGQTSQGQAAIAHPRGVYGRDAVEIEDKIRRWPERAFSLGMAIAEEKGETVLEPSPAVGPEEKTEPSAMQEGEE